MSRATAPKESLREIAKERLTPARLRLGLPAGRHLAVIRLGFHSLAVPFLYRHFLLLSDDRDFQRVPRLVCNNAMRIYIFIP